MRNSMYSDSVPRPTETPAANDRWILHKHALLSVESDGAEGDLWLRMCKGCMMALTETSMKGNECQPAARMPSQALANGLWRGPDPPELASLTYTERKVINLAKVYVSVKRIFLDKATYAATSSTEAPQYHQRNVVAYPQSPDAALVAIGMSPTALAQTLIVQFAGQNEDEMPCYNCGEKGHKASQRPKKEKKT